MPHPSPSGREKAESITREDFARMLAHCLRQAGMAEDATLAVAVSGGPDSLALLHLTHAHARAKGQAMRAYTVDHRLRDASAAEAGMVAALCKTLGVPHRTLPWLQAPDAPRGRHRPEEARQARYRLLREACRRDGASALLLGHHRDDQAETLLHHLLRGSGVDGLAAMRPARLEAGLWLLRPLLDVPKSALIDDCRARSQPWAEDPSNDDPRFARTLLRRLLDEYREGGFSAARLAETATHMARARGALEEWAATAHSTLVRPLACGTTRLDIAGWRGLPEEIRLRVLRAILRDHGAANLRFASLAALDTAMSEEKHGRRSLGGCLWHWRGAEGRQPEAWAYPDPCGLPAPQPASAALPAWRAAGWRIDLPAEADDDGLWLAPLGSEAWEWFCAQEPDSVRAARRIAPPRAWQSVPCLWQRMTDEEFSPLPLGKIRGLPHILTAGESLPASAPSPAVRESGRIPRFTAVHALGDRMPSR